jgi:hypothetical protein
VLKTAKKTNQEKKPDDPKGDFPEAHKEVNYIYGGPDSYEPRMKQKLTAWEVMTVSPATPEYLMWFEVPITFSHSDLSDFFSPCWSGTLSLFAPSSWMLSSTESLSMAVVP